MKKDNPTLRVLYFLFGFVALVLVGLAVLYTAYNFMDFKDMVLNGEVQHCPSFSIQNILISLFVTAITMYGIWFYVRYTFR